MRPTLLLLLLQFTALTVLKAQEDFGNRLAIAAVSLTQEVVTYDPSYFAIAYPNGDVPANKGVCTDVVIRAYRKMGVDLQLQVHLDMKAHFKAYPNLWGLQSTDTNIDHRRVPNLMTFFKRQGAAVPITSQAKDYIAGDLVCWRLDGGATHIGIVSDKMHWSGKRLLIVHNIGNGQVLQDCLFDFNIIGHYRYSQ
ncbi:MAG: DUF1287 domain-containing protein [Bacteroidota bacterium]